MLRSAEDSSLRRWLLRAVAVVCVAAAAGGMDLRAQGPGGPPPFGPGETLKYDVQWRMLPAGNVELTLGRAGDGSGLYQARGKAVSVGYVSNLYKVDDVFESTFRNPTFCSQGIRKTIHEAERHRDVRVEMDSGGGQARVEVKDLEDGTTLHRGEFAIPACVYDVLSALYMARTRELKVGEAFEVPVNDGGETIRVSVEVQGAERIETGLGEFETLRLEPDVFSWKLFTGKGRMFVWIARDGARVPVRLQAQIGVGTIVATLSGIERTAEPAR